MKALVLRGIAIILAALVGLSVLGQDLPKLVVLPREVPVPGTVSPEDFNVWRANFGLSGGGAAGPSTLMQGFVRYIGPAASAVPEPSCVLLCGLGMASLVAAPRRRT